MKNLVIAGGILIVVIAAAFVFTRGEPQESDTLIPSPSPAGKVGFETIFNTGQTTQMSQQPFTVLKAQDIEGKVARIKTAKGDIVFELFADAPLASSNFIALINKRFYDGLIFHRREEGFVIQGGDPKGNGTGGPGYKFNDEPGTRDYTRGIVAIANSGPNTNGSQFFIVLADAPTLPKNYTIFGQVAEGLDIVDQIQVGDKMEKVTIE